MGNISKELMKRANILPKLRLGIKTDKGVKSTGPHRVKLIEEKIVKGKLFSGEVTDMVKFTFEENGEKKQYSVPAKNKEGTEPHYFIQGMSSVEEGEELVIEMIKKGVKNVISIQKIGDASEVETDDHDDDEDVIDITEGDEENG